MIKLRGIAEHFPIRVSEWLMVGPSILMGVALVLQSGMFETSRSYSALAAFMPQQAWGIAILFCAGIRLIALIVNGSFRQFRYSPHMRAVAASVGMIFWGWFGWGFLMALIYNDGAASGTVTYLTLLVPMEFVNIRRALADIRPRGA